MSHDPAVDPRLVAFVEDLVVRARVPAAMREEARADYLEHLQADVARRVAAGSRGDRAIADAIASFGPPQSLREALEASVVIHRVGRDLSNAVRAWWQRPLIAGAVIVTLAIGIGVNAAVYSVVDWVLVRPLPFPSPEELVRIHTAGINPVTAAGDVTHSEFASFARSAAIRSVTGFSTAARVIAAAHIEPTHIVLSRVSGNLSSTFGTPLELGRSFTSAEIQNGEPVAVLGEAAWDRIFHRDGAILGTSVTIDGATHTVIGVVRGTSYPPGTDVWRPITAAEREDDDRELRVVARLLPGASIAAIDAELATLARTASDGKRTAWADRLQQTEVANIERALTTLFAGSVLILLIACANVAALLGARGHDRGAEIAVRQALGASRAQLIAQLLSESVVLTLAGGVTGLLLGRWTLDAIIAIAPASLPRLADISLDMRVAGLGLIATMVVGVVVGLGPAFRASRPNPGAVSHAAGSARVVRRSAGRRLLVLAQVAMAVILTAGASLLTRSLVNLVNVPNGFDAERLIAVELYLRGAFTGDSRQLFRELTAAAAAVPGVRSASVAMRLPTQTAGIRAPLSVVGAGNEPKAVVLRPISYSYFETASIAVRSGRAFALTDLRNTPRVAIVNARAVRDCFNNQSPIGAHVTTSLTRGPMEIVGVVDDVTPAGEADRPALYVPIEQLAVGDGYLLVQSIADPETILPVLRERLHAAAPALALDRMQLVRHTLEDSRAATRFSSVLGSAFALLALLLAIIGVYGLTASEVAVRWRELGVRVALGASPRQALWTAVRPCAVVLGAGAGVGVATAATVAPRLGSMLYHVNPRDVTILVAAPALLALTGLIAAISAAAPVLRVDPALTLRE